MITDIYSKRQKRLHGDFPDVYQYEDIPKPLRIQIMYLLNDICEYRVLSYGPRQPSVYICADLYKHINKVLCTEYGVRGLGHVLSKPDEAVKKLLTETGNTDEVLDVVEVAFQFLERAVLSFYSSPENADMTIAKQKILELNTRFKEHGVGYQYEAGYIIRIDSQYVHSKAMKPALNLISDPTYQFVNTEFLAAHKHYRKKDYKECVQACSNAFESTLKIICDSKGWQYTEKATAATLVNIVFEKGMLPTHKKSFFDGVRGGLEHGVPTTRNKMSAHGLGNKELPVPDYMAEYMLNLTASGILLLIRASEE